jgi:hypothetical protein
MPGAFVVKHLTDRFSLPQVNIDALLRQFSGAFGQVPVNSAVRPADGPARPPSGSEVAAKHVAKARPARSAHASSFV